MSGLFLEGPIFRVAYVRTEICVSKSIGVACSGKEIYQFCFVLLCIRGQIPSTSRLGAYIWRSDLTEGFLRYDFGGLTFGEAIERRVFCVTILGGLHLEERFNGGFFALRFWGAYIWRSDLTEGFLRYDFGGLTFGGAYFRNFTVT